MSFLILKQIVLYILLGFVLAFIFSPIYNFLVKIIKSPTLSATIISLILISLILLPIWFFTPLVIDQAFKLYLKAQNTNFTSILKGIFPSLFASEQFSTEVGGMIQSFITKLGNSALDILSNLILNFPTLMLNLVVVFFTFFFVLRDKDKLIGYIKSVSPFSKDVEGKLFQYSKDITAAILYGQVVIGFFQGIVMFIGFLLFDVPSAFILGIVSIIVGILPMVGPMIVWLPVMIYFIISNNNFAAIGILIFGLVASNLENILRPIFVSRRVKIHSAVVLVGMIGGLFFFGILGIILGPLILSYLIVILEVYRERRSKGSIYAGLIRED